MSRRTTVVAAVLAATAAGVLWWRLRQEPGTGTTVSAVDDAHDPAPVAHLARWVPSAPTSRIGRIAGYLWAAPLTAAGLVLGATSGVVPRCHGGALLFTDVRGLPRRMLRWRGFSAATLGHVIIAVGRPGPRLLRHELVHVRQTERLGPVFVPLYLAFLARYGYRRNPLERAAYRAQDAAT